MNHHWRWLTKSAYLILFLFSVFLFGCTTYLRAVTPCSTTGGQTKNKEIYIHNHGWHTGLVVTTKELNHIFPALAVRFPQANYYEIGWGEAGFYQAKRFTLGLAFNGIFCSSGTVLHVVGLTEKPEQHYRPSDLRCIRVCPTQYAPFLKFVQSSFKLDASGQIQPLGKGLYGNSQFYQGTGHYHALNTCNKWTAKALASAGVPINPDFKLTASSVMEGIDRCQLKHSSAFLRPSIPIVQKPSIR